MRPFVCAGAGFLLAVLWFDLMFDVQVLRMAPGADPGAAVASIAAYYRRVTTKARPMNRLVAAAMVATIGCVVAQVARGEGPAWAAWTSLALVVLPVSVAARRTVPNAVRLGTAVDSEPQKLAMAESIGRDHVFCFICIAALLLVQLAFAR